jgi:hypothetical protein
MTRDLKQTALIVIAWLKDNHVVVVVSAVALLFTSFLVYQWYQVRELQNYTHRLELTLDSVQVVVKDLEFDRAQINDEHSEIQDEARKAYQQSVRAEEMAERAQENAMRAIGVAEEALYN